MSLEAFHAGLARLVADPDLVRRVRAGDVAPLHEGDVTEREAARLAAMAADPRMAVMCSLYRSNRLTALVRTVPSVVDALGDRLSGTVSEFWREHARTDLQFRSEAEAFCDFVRRRQADDQQLLDVVVRAETELGAAYASRTQPRREPWQRSPSGPPARRCSSGPTPH